MGKKTVYISILSFIFLNASSQIIGIQAGVELNRIHIIQVNSEQKSESFKASPGFGLTFTYRFGSRSYLNTGIFYSETKNEVLEANSQDPDYQNSFTWNLSHRSLRLPVQYGLSVIRQPVDISLFAGLNVGYGLKFEHTETITESYYETYDLYKEKWAGFYKFYAGLGAGIMAKYRNFSLVIQYSFDVLMMDFEVDEFAFGKEIISINAGYSFDLGKKN